MKMVKLLVGLLLAFCSLTALAATDDFFSDGEYILPNEADFSAYRYLSPGAPGTLVSVGTFRGLTAAANGDFDHVIQMDIDAGVVAFNLFNRELLQNEKITDRFEYMVALLGRERDEQLLNAVRRKKITESKFLTAVYRSPLTAEKNQTDLEKKVRCLGARCSDKDSTVNYYLGQRLIELSKDQKNWTASYMGSDKNFEKIKSLVRNGGLTVFRGSITRQDSTKKIQIILKEFKTKLSLLDISNVPDYLSGAQLSSFQQLWTQLKMKTGDASMIMTRIANPISDELTFDHSKWLYFKIPLNTDLKKNMYLAHDSVDNGESMPLRATNQRGPYGKGKIAPLVVEYKSKRKFLFKDDPSFNENFGALKCSGIY